MPWTCRFPTHLLDNAVDLPIPPNPGTSHLLDNAIDTPLLIANAEVPHLPADPADLLISRRRHRPG